MQLPEFLTKKYLGVPGWAIVGVGIGVGAFILWRQQSSSSTAAATGSTAGGTASPSTYGDWQYGYGTGSNPSPPPPVAADVVPQGMVSIGQVQSQFPDIWSWLSTNKIADASNPSVPINLSWILANPGSFGVTSAPPAYTLGPAQPSAYQPTTSPTSTNAAPTPAIAAPAPAFLSGAA